MVCWSYLDFKGINIVLHMHLTHVERVVLTFSHTQSAWVTSVAGALEVNELHFNQDCRQPRWRHLPAWLFNVKYTAHRPWQLNPTVWGEPYNSVQCFIVKILSLGAVEVATSVLKQLISVTRSPPKLWGYLGLGILSHRDSYRIKYSIDSIGYYWYYSLRATPLCLHPQRNMGVGVITL